MSVLNKFCLLVFLICLSPFVGYSQISGVINSYTQITSIDACLNTLDVSSTSGFIVGQKVLIIQMKGAELDQTNTANFGNITNLGVAGNYEFNRIAAISGNTVGFVSPLTRTYDPANVLQMVTVPEYTDVTITGTLTCNYWNNNVGGILVFEASGTVTFNADIDVNERGFHGGLKGGPGPNNNCQTTFFNSTAQNIGGFKAEGMAKMVAGFEQGRGKWLQGGGGGNNHNTGGGGGGNGGAGGQGGFYNGCANNSYPGVGGLALPYSNVDKKLFMGGGGGGGHDNNGVGSQGGFAGGMVIINATTISGNNRTVFANGQAGLNAVTNGSSSDGAGGGASGGSIVLNVGNYSSGFSIQARGGAGGANVGATDPHGTGGGGSGGFVWFSGGALPGSIALDLSGGAAGLCQDNNCLGITNGAQPGQNGNSLSNLVHPAIIPTPFVPLSVTATPTNVTCFGACNGGGASTPAGGVPPYTYAWSNGQTGQNLTNVCPGSYTLTVKDSKNCTATASVTITQPASPLNVTFTQTNNLCLGAAQGTINVTTSGGTAGYTYAWADGPTTEDRSALLAGNYCLTVTDANACTQTICVTITAPPVGVTTTTTQNNVKCFGDNNGSITVTVANATGTPTIVWTPPSVTGLTPTGLQPGVYSFTVTDASSCSANGTITITGPTQPLNVSASQTDVKCFGLSTGSIDLTVSGGTPPYNFSWNNGQFLTEDLSNIPANVYTVKVTDANNCTATLSKTITQPTAALSATSVKTNVDCKGNSTGKIDVTTVGGTPPYTFSWTNGVATEDNLNLVANSYTLTITDANGCTFGLSQTITEPAAVLAVAVTKGDMACFGDNDGFINLNITGGTAGYNVSWSDGAFGANRTNLTPATYSYTVKDQNNCTETGSVTINGPLQPFVVTNTKVDVKCFGQSTGSIDLTVTGGTPPYTYAWSNTATVQDINALAAGNYSCTVRDANQCQQIVTITIAQPTAPLAASTTKTDVACFGQSTGKVNLTVTGGTPPYSYAWTPNGAVTQNLTNVPVNTYNVTITDANNCTTTASATLTQPAAPISVQNSITDELCFGQNQGAIDLTPTGGTPPYTILWSNNATTIDLNGVSTGSYNYTLTDSKGCTFSESLTINGPANPLAVQITQQNVKCFGGNDGSINATTTGGTLPYTFAWTGGATTEDISTLTAGVYQLIVTDAQNCQATQSVTITQPAAPISLSVTHQDVKCFNEATGSIDLTVNGGTSPYTYNWSNGATTQDVGGLIKGAFDVLVTDANGCTATIGASISQPSAGLSLSTQKTDVSCFGVGDGAIDATVGGGTPPYTYLWQPGFANTEDVTGLTPNNYVLTVTDANQCTITEAVVITQPGQVTTDFIVNDICEPAQLVIQDNSTYAGTIANYQWDFESDGTTDAQGANLTNVQFNYPSSGKYDVTLTLTTDAGCVYTRTKSVKVHPQPQPTFAAPAVCLGLTTAYDATASTVVTSTALPNSIIDYAWDFNNDGTADAHSSNGLATNVFANDGLHPVTLVVTTNNGCQNTFSLDVNVFPVPNPQFIADPVCLGELTQFDASTSAINAPGVINLYEWEVTGDNQFDLTGQTAQFQFPAPGSYNITLRETSGDGCIRSVSRVVTVYPLPVAVFSANTVCKDDSTSFNASLSNVSSGTIVDYLWDFNGDGQTDANGIKVKYLFPDSGHYNVKLTVVTAVGCSTSFNQIVYVKPLPDAAFSFPQNVCEQQPIIVEYTGVPLPGQTITWDWGTAQILSSQGNKFQIFYPNPGAYPIKLTVVADGCVTVNSQTINLFSIPTIDAGGDVGLCKGDSIQLDGDIINVSGTGGCSYFWVPINGSLNTMDDQTLLNPTVWPEFTTEYQLQCNCNGCVSNLDVVKVYVSVPPILSLDSLEVSYCAGTGGVPLTSTIVGGTGSQSAGYAYYWSPATGLSNAFVKTPTASPTITTVYTVYAVDSAGCKSNEEIIKVNVNQVPIADAGADKFYCAGSNIGVQLEPNIPGGFGSFQYHWLPEAGLSNPNIANPFASPDSTTIYTLYLVDNLTGCASNPTTLNDLATVVVEVRPIPIAEAGPDTVFACQNVPVQIGDFAHGAGPTYSYQWTPIDGLSNATINRPFASPNFTTKYYLTVTSNGCPSVADSVVVFITPEPTVALQDSFVICPKDSVKLLVTTNPLSGNFTYQWIPALGLSNPNVKSPTASPSATTTYTLLVKLNGCLLSREVTTTVYVQPVPTVDANPDNSPKFICPSTGGAADLTAVVSNPLNLPYNIQWEPADSLSDPNSLSTLANPKETTTYTLTITTENQCVVTDTVTVFVLPEVTAEIAFSADEICEGDSITLVAKGGIGSATYKWTWLDDVAGASGAFGQTIVVYPKGNTIYSLEVIEGACNDFAQLAVIVKPGASPDFVPSAVYGCVGTNVLFQNYSTGVTGGYVWNFGDNTAESNEESPIHAFAEPGIYPVKLTVKTAEGCEYYAKTVNIHVIGIENLDFTSEPLYPAEMVIPQSGVQFTPEFEGGVTYLWQFGDGQSSTERAPYHVFNLVGTFEVNLTVTDSAGCNYTVKHAPYVVKDPDLNIYNVFTPGNDDGINDVWKPTYDGHFSYKATVYDRWGVTLYSFSDTEKGWDGTVNGSPSPSGAYFYTVEINNRLIKGNLTLLRTK